MIDKVSIARDFLQNQVPELIENLEEDAKPGWGEMTALEMLEHLIITLKVSQGEANVPIVTLPDQFERIRDYLNGNNPIPKYVKFPISDEEREKWHIPSLEEAKERLVVEIKGYLEFVRKAPDFIADHPYAGPMSTDELVAFHKKHFIHHFTQFGLINSND